jgi:hypothetical protein
MSVLKELRLFANLKSALLLFLMGAGMCFGQSKWELRNLLLQGNTLNSVTYGKNLFVTVGNEGAISTSSDAITWHIINSGTSYRLRSVA